MVRAQAEQHENQRKHHSQEVALPQVQGFRYLRAHSIVRWYDRTEMRQNFAAMPMEEHMEQSKLSRMLGAEKKEAPYERGLADGMAGKPGPAFPMPDSAWAERLYAAGWSRGVDVRSNAALTGERTEEL